MSLHRQRWAHTPRTRTEASHGRDDGHGLATLLLSPFWWVAATTTILVPAAWQRLVGADPTSTPTGWTQRQRRRSRLDHATLPTHLERRRNSGERTRWFAIAAVACVALVWATPLGGSLVTSDETTGFRLSPQTPDRSVTEQELPPLEHPVAATLRAAWPSEDTQPIALHGSPWWQEEAFGSGQGAVFNPGIAWRPNNPYRALDFRSAYVNVLHGERHSWRAPPCSCRRVTLWMYGGSTTFGLHQRDEHTIGSELAKVAHEHGVALDVHNRGAMGHLHWQEAERFALDLTVDEPPDLVLFYDGANDTWATNSINMLQTVDIDAPFDPTLIDAWRHSGRSDQQAPPTPPGGRFVGLPPGPGLELVDLARTTVARYDRSRRISRSTAERHGVMARYVWQPTRYSRDLIPSEPHGSGTEENHSRMYDQLQRSFLPDDVIDLVDVFDDNSDPLFTDDVHHNEAGARIVAEAMYAKMADDIETLRTTKEQP